MFISSRYRPLIWAKWARVKLDGTDISSWCYAANDKRGIALCYRANDAGKKHLDPNNPRRAAREIRRGKIELSIDPNAPERVKQLWAQKVAGV